MPADLRDNFGLRRKPMYKFIALVAAVVIAVNATIVALRPDLRQWLEVRLGDRVSYGATRGFACRTHLAPDGTRHRYVVFVPYGLKEEDRPPVIMYLNGFGKNGSDGIAHLKDGLGPAIWETRGTFPFVAVFPQCLRDHSWSQDYRMDRLAVNILQEVTEEFHADPDRVLLTGLSSGASGVWAVAANHPDLFAGIIPTSAGRIHPDSRQAILDAQIPVWSFYVDQDEQHIVKGSVEVWKSLLRDGGSPQFTEIRTGARGVNMNLHDSWSYAFRSSGLIEWMWQQNRSRRLTEVSGFTLHDVSELRSAIPSISDYESGREHWFNGFEIHLNDAGRALVPLPLEAEGTMECHFEFLAGPDLLGCGFGLARISENRIESGWFVEAATQESAEGGFFSLPDAEPLASLSAVAGHALRPDDWNELRIRVDSGMATATLNGWALAESFPLKADAGEESSPQLFLEVHGAASTTIPFCLLRTHNCRRLSQPRLSEQISLPGEAGSRPLQSVFPDVDLQTVDQAWRRWSDLTSPVRMAWKLNRNDVARWSRYCASLPAPQEDAEPVGTIELTPDRLFCQSTWLNAQERISRTQGLIYDPASDYESIQAARFDDDLMQRGQPASLTSVRSNESRLDYITVNDASTSHGIKFDRSDVREVRIGDLAELAMTAPALAVQPLAAHGGSIDLKACQLDDVTRPIAGEPCVIMTEQLRDDGSLWREYWLDPRRDYRILRMQTWQNQRLAERVDVNYVEDETYGWRPSAWSVATRPQPAESLSHRFYPGNTLLFEFAHMDVTEWSADTSASVDRGPVQVPAGTAFYEQASGEWLVQRDDGGTEPLDPDSVARLASGGSPQNGSSSFRSWLLPAVIVLIVTSLVIRRSRAAKARARTL